MLCQEDRRRNVQRHLGRFLQSFAGPKQADKTRAKFFYQAVGGIVHSGSLIVRRWCRWIADGCREPFYRQKRLLNQLKSQDWDHRPLLSSYQRWAASLVQQDTAWTRR